MLESGALQALSRGHGRERGVVDLGARRDVVEGGSARGSGRLGLDQLVRKEGALFREPARRLIRTREIRWRKRKRRRSQYE